MIQRQREKVQPSETTIHWLKNHLDVGHVDVERDDFGATPRVRVEDDDARRLVRMVDRDHRLLRQRVVVLPVVIL